MKTMKSHRVLTALLIIAVLALVIVVAGCGQDNDNTGNTALETGKGRVCGYVSDNEELLSSGTKPQKYEGAKIEVMEAIASGTYKSSGSEPVQTNYGPGKIVIETKSQNGGYWQADLAPGKYFIRAFYGDKSYTEQILVEIKEGKTTDLDLGLIHGV